MADLKAVLLSAGQGSRLRPMTDDRPKGMVEIAGVSILERQVSLFRDVGIEDIVIVGGYRHDTIPETLGVKCINQEFAHTNMVYSLFSAYEEFRDADGIVVSYGDILYSRSVLEALLASAEAFSVVVDDEWLPYFSQRAVNVLDDAESLATKAGYITDIGRSVETLEEIEAQYIGLSKFDHYGIEGLSEIFRNSMSTGSSIGWGRIVREAYMTDLLQEAINNGPSGQGRPLSQAVGSRSTRSLTTGWRNPWSTPCRPSTTDGLAIPLRHCLLPEWAGSSEG